MDAQMSLLIHTNTESTMGWEVVLGSFVQPSKTHTPQPRQA